MRDLHDIPVSGRMVDSGTRVNPFRPTIMGSIRTNKGAAPDPIQELRHVLSDPNVPTTADPLVRFKESPDARHTRLYHRQPDVGGSAPWQGLTMRIFKDRIGGVPALPAPLLNGLELPDPRTVPSQGTVLKGLRARIGSARRGLKPVVRLSPGLGGLDIAQSTRLVPDTPSGSREVLRDIRPKSLRGTFIGHRTAPEPVVDALGAARGRQMLPPPPPEQGSSVQLSETLSPPDLKHSPPVPTEPVALVANTASEGGEPSPTINFGVLALAAVALLVVFKS
jgi:hypothetical protein